MNRQDLDALDELVELVDNLAEAYAKAGDEVRDPLQSSLDVALRQLYKVTAKFELSKHDPELETKADCLPELDVDSCLEDEDGDMSGACQRAGYEAVEAYLESIHFSKKQICLDDVWHRVDDFTDEEIREIIDDEIGNSDDETYVEAREKAGTCEDSRKWLKRFCYALIELTGSGLTLETCDFEPRMTSKFDYDDEGLQKYWVGECYNQWNARNFSAEEAMAAQGTLYECYYCVDCVDCYECKYCHRCKDCRDCNYCEDSVKCDTCDYCHGCQDCDHCEYSKEFVNAEHCKYGEHCEDCKFCLHCSNCRGCEHCQGLHGQEDVRFNQVEEPEEEAEEAGAEPAKPAGRYLVIDLSAGPDAASYPHRYSETGPNLDDDACRTTELWLRELPAGTFMMGSPRSEGIRYGNEDLHQVTLTKPYYMGVFQLTQCQWALVMGDNPSGYRGADRPVDSVSYEDIRGEGTPELSWPRGGHKVPEDSFLGRLQRKTGLVLDLPTEAQWEYACRAGSQAAFNSGKRVTDDCRCPNLDKLGRYAFNQKDGVGGYDEGHTRVGSYQPNAWGLYDMHGNVWEWCLDYRINPLGSSAVTDPQGPASGDTRALRGGGWDDRALNCRCASRFGGGPSNGSNELNEGFRLMCLPEDQED